MVKLLCLDLFLYGVWVTPLGRGWGDPHESYPCDLGWPRANSITHLPGVGRDQVKMNTFAETLSGPLVLVLGDGWMKSRVV